MSLSGEKGWTIIELLLTLFLLGLIVTIATPCIANVGERVQREVFLTLLSSDLQLAQSEALSREKIVEVQILDKWIMIKQGRMLLRKIQIPSVYTLKTNYHHGIITYRKTGQVRGGKIEMFKNNRRVGLIIIEVATGCPKVDISLV